MNLLLRTVIRTSDCSSDLLLFFFLRQPIVRDRGILRLCTNWKHIWNVHNWRIQTSFLWSFSCVDHWILDLIKVEWLTSDLDLLILIGTSWSSLRNIPFLSNYFSRSFLRLWSFRSWLILSPWVNLRLSKFSFSSSWINSSGRMSMQGIINFAHLINRFSTLRRANLRFDHSSLSIWALDFHSLSKRILHSCLLSVSTEKSKSFLNINSLMFILICMINE